MLFSIVIPVLNEEKNLQACVESCQKQEGDFDYEIIVVDNNSTDNTLAIANGLGVKVLKEIRQGVGQARETGTAVTRGEYIVHLDGDSRMPPTYLLDVYKKFEKDPKLVSLGGQMFFYDATWWMGIVSPVLHYLFYGLVFVTMRGRIGPLGNNMVFKKSIYDKTKGFNVNLQYGEDADINKKLSKFGKVRLFMDLKCYVSARRFNFLDKKFWLYSLNFFKLCFTGKPYKNEL